MIVSAPDTLESSESLQQKFLSPLSTVTLFSKLLYKSIMYLGADIFRPCSRVFKVSRGRRGKPRRFRISRWSLIDVEPFLTDDEESALAFSFFCEVWGCCRGFTLRLGNERRFTMLLSRSFCEVPFLTTADASVSLPLHGERWRAKLTINNLYRQVILRCQICSIEYAKRTCDVVFWKWTKLDSCIKGYRYDRFTLQQNRSVNQTEQLIARATTARFPNQSKHCSFVRELKKGT